MRIMKKLTLIASCVALLLSSCAHEYNQVLKSGDYTYKYEYAKQSYAQGKYSRAIPLLQELVTMKKGSTEGEECLYMLAMAEYGMKDYETAAEYFKKYYSSYPKGKFAENAKYFVGESLYQNAPEPRLDQSTTITAIAAFRSFWIFILMPDSSSRLQTAFLLFRTSWLRRSIRVPSSILIWAPISATVPAEATIMRLVS